MRLLKLTTFLVFTAMAAVTFLIIAAFTFPRVKKIGPALLQFYCTISLNILGVRIDAADQIHVPASKNRGIILIANHVSLLDILVMSALYRTIFLSKDEVRQYPVIGLVAALIGIIFLKRESPFDRHRVIRKIARHVSGRIIAIFPQGTTGSIEDRLPFKRGIFKAVEINPEAVLLPVTLRYKEDGIIVWKRDQNLFDNLKTICAQKRISVKVSVHPPMSIEDYTDKTVSDMCFDAQEKVFSRLLSEY